MKRCVYVRGYVAVTCVALSVPARAYQPELPAVLSREVLPEIPTATAVSRFPIGRVTDHHVLLEETQKQADVILKAPLPDALHRAARADPNSDAERVVSKSIAAGLTRAFDDDGLPDPVIVSLDFDAAPLSQVLKTFADFARVNIVVADGVRGTVSLHLRNVRWRHAFSALLDAHGLAVQRHGTILWLVPADQLATRERRRADSTWQAAMTESLETEVFELHYLRADAARQLIAGAGNARLLSRRGAASADTRTNQLFVSETPANLERIRAVIARADRATRQVLIEARIVEAEDGFGRNLGARLSLLGTGTSVADAAHVAANGGYPSIFASAHSPGAVAGMSSGPASSAVPASSTRRQNSAKTGSASDESPATQGKASADSPADSRATLDGTMAGAVGALYSFPAGSLAGFGPAGVGLALLSVGAQRVLALELSALEADGRGRVVSSPRVVTADRVKALIEQGTELPYQAKIGDSESSVQFRRAGLKLEVTPQITPSGHVMLELDITKDTVGMNTQSGPAINTKHVHTQVQVENGGTVAIGGIYIQDERDDVAAVPGLGALPLVGALFRRHSASRTKSELIVFITPNVVASPPGAGSARASQNARTAGRFGADSTKPVDSSLIPPT